MKVNLWKRKMTLMKGTSKPRMGILKDTSPVDLNKLKEQTGLSIKKWDLAIKGLRKHNLA